MSVETVNMFFRAGELYFDNVRIGNMRNVNFVFTKELVPATPGDSVNVVRRDLKSESAVLTGTVCDITIERIPMLLGLTMSTSQLTATTTLRVQEDKTMKSTTQVTLAENAVTTTNVKIFRPDYSYQYVKGSDYSITNTALNKTKIKVKSATMARDPVIVEYDYPDKSALCVKVGGKLTHEEKKLKFVHTMSNGKRLQITIPKAQMTGEFSMPFDEGKHSDFNVSFTAIGDPSLAKGQRLFKIVKER